MKNFPLCIYLINTLLLILHEIDSAFWKEWKMFHIPGGETGFLLLHIPLLLPILYGIPLLDRGMYSGFIISLFVALAGLFAFSIHMYFIMHGHKEFNTPISLTILWVLLPGSLIQLGLTILIMT